MPEPTHLLVIGAYRDNEVEPPHPLLATLDELRHASVDVRTVGLACLPDEEVHAIVADTLHATRSQVRELAELVMEKTSGNPFFIDEFLRTLHAERRIAFSSRAGTWTWDLREVKGLGITDNLADLMVRRLERLPVATLEVLRLAACLGSDFDLELLAEAGSSPLARPLARCDLAADTEVWSLLSPAIHERLVGPLDTGWPSGAAGLVSDGHRHTASCSYRFLHDRVQQAAYESIPENLRPSLHLHLGRILLAKASPETRGEKIFDIVDQLNRGLGLVLEESERVLFAALNLEAGKRARRTTAYKEGLAYLRCGIDLLPKDAWTKHYRLSFALHLSYAECAYLAGHFHEAEGFSNAFRPRIRTATEMAELYAIRIVLESNRGRYDRALELEREALGALGHPVPRMKTALPLVAARAKVALAMTGRDVETLAKLPDLADPRDMAAMKIISKLWPPSHFADKRFFAWAVHENLYIAIKRGLSAAAAPGCSHYGMYLAAERDYGRALAYGKLALTLANREDARAYRSHVYFIFGLCIKPYARDHLRTCIPFMERAIEFGLESGDLLFICYAAATLPMVMFMVGDSIDDVYAETERRERSIRAFRSDDMILYLRVLRQGMRCLRGETQGRASLTTDDLQESALFADVHASPALLPRGFYLMVKIILLTLFGETREAVEMILRSEKVIASGDEVSVYYTEYSFFACLALIEGLRDPELDKSAIERMLKRKHMLLADLAKVAPMNFRHKHLLVSAELAELKRRPSLASKRYEQAIREATLNGYPQHAALASELAGRALSRRGRRQAAQSYLEAARAGYGRWGAAEKVRALTEAYPESFRSRAREHASTTVASERAPATLDVVSIVRASQALSSEISLPALLERMMRVIVQTSGAQRGSLLVEQDGQLRVEAHLDAAKNVLRLSPEHAVEVGDVASEAIVRYVLRSGEDVVLAHAEQGGAFTHDPYVACHASKSLLCLVVRHRDRAAGVLFLENDLSTHAFTEERLEMLRLLVAQAAISLENARLYESTQKLNRALRASEALLRELFEGMPVGVYMVDAQGRATFANRRATEILGQGVDPALTPDSATFYQAYVAGSNESYPKSRIPLLRALEGERSMVDDIEIRLHDRTVPLAIWGTPVRGDDGAVRYAILAFQDISLQRAADADRARLVEQLSQTERLESIGRLAGGVAHDFNNLLTPILALSDLAAGSLPSDAPIRGHLVQIRRAAEHAAELTRQLLAFGRRQVLEPQVLDLNQELRNFEGMLRRVVREDIDVQLRLDPELGRVRADPAQVQRVFMNLAMNAADAMPRGGQLTLETENVFRSGAPNALDTAEPLGQCVVLRVSDTGHGMDKQTLAKVFDPFFTTKAPGKGTGLGLPTVHGLVTQHGGQLLVRSEQGRGTTFELFLPRVSEHGGKRTPVPSPEKEHRPSGHGETILVVEDDAAVRAVVEDVLRNDGYCVFATGEPTEALSIAHTLGERLELLVTDVVMPVMNGPTLLDTLLRTQPALAALFVSGYSEGALSEVAALDARGELLEKPFLASELRAKVRAIFETRAKSRTRA